MAQELSIESRREKVTKLLSYQGFVSLAELIDNLNVSESTVRRDLEILEGQGLIRRTHGGAVYVKDTAQHPYAFVDRQTAAAAEKCAIARATAELLTDGQTVLIDGGTTCYEVAREMSGRRMNVVTNSLPIASLLSAEVATEVTLLGGYVYPRTGVALGSMAEQQAELVHGSLVVLSCAGLADDGAYNPNQMMVDVERKMMAAADEVVFVVDHTKFGHRAVAHLCDLSEIDVIVTDDGVDADSRAWLSRLDARVVIAETDAGEP